MSKIPTINYVSLIGFKTRKTCPRCRAPIFRNKNDDQWCSECSWSTDAELTSFSKSILESLKIKDKNVK
jgi:uncharacterized Zn finger protein (UPF0148 family)